MKFLLFFSLIAAANIARAAICHTQLVHTICGSGKVELTFDKGSGSFTSSNGDVECWFSDSTVYGEMVRLEPKYPYFLEESYTLKVYEKENNYALLLYDPALKSARLEILIPGFHPGILSKVYNLSCSL